MLELEVSSHFNAGAAEDFVNHSSPVYYTTSPKHTICWHQMHARKGVSDMGSFQFMIILRQNVYRLARNELWVCKFNIGSQTPPIERSQTAVAI